MAGLRSQITYSIMTHLLFYWIFNRCKKSLHKTWKKNIREGNLGKCARILCLKKPVRTFVMTNGVHRLLRTWERKVPTRRKSMETVDENGVWRINTSLEPEPNVILIIKKHRLTWLCWKDGWMVTSEGAKRKAQPEEGADQGSCGQ